MFCVNHQPLFNMPSHCIYYTLWLTYEMLFEGIDFPMRKRNRSKMTYYVMVLVLSSCDSTTLVIFRTSRASCIFNLVLNCAISKFTSDPVHSRKKEYADSEFVCQEPAVICLTLPYKNIWWVRHRRFTMVQIKECHF